MLHSQGIGSEKEQFWRLVLEEHTISGLSVREFCERESLSQPSFYGWRRKLRRGDSQSTDTLPNGLVPVHVTNETATASYAIEIVMPGNVVVRVQDDCSSEAIRRALAAVRETRSC